MREPLVADDRFRSQGLSKRAIGLATFRVLPGATSTPPRRPLSNQRGRAAGGCDAAQIVRQQQPSAAPTASNRGCLHENAVAPDRSAVSLLHLAEQAPAEVGGRSPNSSVATARVRWIPASTTVSAVTRARRRPRRLPPDLMSATVGHDSRELLDPSKHGQTPAFASLRNACVWPPAHEIEQGDDCSCKRCENERFRSDGHVSGGPLHRCRWPIEDYWAARAARRPVSSALPARQAAAIAAAACAICPTACAIPTASVNTV